MYLVMFVNNCNNWSTYDRSLTIFMFFSFQEKDIYVTKILQRQGGFYIMEAEVLVNFNDFNKCQSVVNILVEKLDDSVKVSQPMYYHSPNSLEYVR